MVTKQKQFLDSLRQMVSKTPEDVCPNCKKAHAGNICSENDVKDGGVSDKQISEAAFLVDLVSNHKIRIPTPSCAIGRDETNDIVVSGDQSISRHHLRLTNTDGQYYLEDNDSRHGTFLNGTQLKARELINDGDVIKIGVSLFWFVIEANNAIEDNNDSASNYTGLVKGNGSEPAHLNVRSDNSKPSDSKSSTMNEIPVISNEQSLLENLRLKTRSFDQAGLFNSTQAQSATTSPQRAPAAEVSLEDTQSSLPAIGIDSLMDSDNEETDNLPHSNPAMEAKPQATNISSPEIINGSPLYDQLMSSDLSELNNKYSHLNDEINKLQKERKEIADQLNTFKSLGLGLLAGTDGKLIEACQKIFSHLGWQASPNAHDSQELLLKLNGQISIARIIWTKGEPERSHLGQLSISQTQLWCDQGEEPKGILVISRLVNNNNEIPTLTKADYESELAKYATKKNVCMMTTMQVLAIYRDLALKHVDVNTLREKIINSAGWLEGFTIK